MSDHLLRALVVDADLRAIALTSTGLCREAIERHGLSPSSGLALAEGLTTGLLLTFLHKDPLRVNLQLRCDGPLGGLVVDASPQGGVRGYVMAGGLHFSDGEGPTLAPALGTGGTLNVLRQMRGGQWYQGVVEIPERSVQGAALRYLQSSEQVDVALKVEVVMDSEGQVEAAGGVLFERLPDGNRAALSLMQERLASGLLRESLRAQGGDRGASAGALLEVMLGGPEGKGGDNLQIFERLDVSFQCDCGLERIQQMMEGLPTQDLVEMIDEDQGATITCEFCCTHYLLDQAALQGILERRADPRGGDA